MWVPKWVAGPYLRISREAGILDAETISGRHGLSRGMVDQLLLHMRRNLMLSSLGRGKYIVTPEEKWLGIAWLFASYPPLEADLKGFFLDKVHEIKALVLHGSRSFGSAGKDSDYDFFMVVSTPEAREEFETRKKELSRGVNFDIFSEEGFKRKLGTAPLYFKFVFGSPKVVFDGLDIETQAKALRLRPFHLLPELAKVKLNLDSIDLKNVYSPIYLGMESLRTLAACELALEGTFRERELSRKMAAFDFSGKGEILRIHRHIANFGEERPTRVSSREISSFLTLVKNEFERVKLKARRAFTEEFGSGFSTELAKTVWVINDKGR